MITTVSLLTGRSDLSRAGLIDYYENHHVPLNLGFPLRPLSYERLYLPEGADRRFEADFDVMTQMTFENEQAYESWLAVVLASDSGVAEDEARLFDRSKTRSWFVEEHVSVMNGVS